MIMAVGLIVSKIGRGQSSEASGHNEIKVCKSLNTLFRTTFCVLSETSGLVQSDYIWIKIKIKIWLQGFYSRISPKLQKGPFRRFVLSEYTFS